MSFVAMVPCPPKRSQKAGSCFHTTGDDSAAGKSGRQRRVLLIWCSNTTHWQDAFLSVMRSFINLGDLCCQNKELASTNNKDIQQAIKLRKRLLICIPCGGGATTTPVLSLNWCEVIQCFYTWIQWQPCQFKKKHSRPMATCFKKRPTNTVDGWNPVPPRMMIIWLFLGF